MVKPGGTGRPRLAISARFAPLPPRRLRISLLPSAVPPPKLETHFGILTCSISEEAADSGGFSEVALYWPKRSFRSTAEFGERFRLFLVACRTRSCSRRRTGGRGPK